jgi:hypothetical protein
VPVGFQINSPSITVPAGAEAAFCFSFRTPNNHTAAISAWTSEMVNVERMIMVFTPSEGNPPGTLSATGCGLFGFPAGGSATNIPSWAYVARTPDAAFQFPADDGTGTPVGQIVPGNQPGTCGST